jgi:hypothetical protein
MFSNHKLYFTVHFYFSAHFSASILFLQYFFIRFLFFKLLDIFSETNLLNPSPFYFTLISVVSYLQDNHGKNCTKDYAVCLSLELQPTLCKLKQALHLPFFPLSYFFSLSVAVGRRWGGGGVEPMHGLINYKDTKMLSSRNIELQNDFAEGIF